MIRNGTEARVSKHSPYPKQQGIDLPNDSSPQNPLDVLNRRSPYCHSCPQCSRGRVEETRWKPAGSESERESPLRYPTESQPSMGTCFGMEDGGITDLGRVSPP